MIAIFKNINNERFMMTGKQFKLLRERLGFSSVKLAERFDCTDRTIRNWQQRAKVDGIVSLAMETLRIEHNDKESDNVC